MAGLTHKDTQEGRETIHPPLGEANIIGNDPAEEKPKDILVENNPTKGTAERGLNPNRSRACGGTSGLTHSRGFFRSVVGKPQMINHVPCLEVTKDTS